MRQAALSLLPLPATGLAPSVQPGSQATGGEAARAPRMRVYG